MGIMSDVTQFEIDDMFEYFEKAESVPQFSNKHGKSIQPSKLKALAKENGWGDVATETAALLTFPHKSSLIRPFTNDELTTVLNSNSMYIDKNYKDFLTKNEPNTKMRSKLAQEFFNHIANKEKELNDDAKRTFVMGSTGVESSYFRSYQNSKSKRPLAHELTKNQIKTLIKQIEYSYKLLDQIDKSSNRYKMENIFKSDGDPRISIPSILNELSKEINLVVSQYNEITGEYDSSALNELKDVLDNINKISEKKFIWPGEGGIKSLEDFKSYFKDFEKQREEFINAYSVDTSGSHNDVHGTDKPKNIKVESKYKEESDILNELEPWLSKNVKTYIDAGTKRAKYADDMAKQFLEKNFAISDFYDAQDLDDVTQVSTLIQQWMDDNKYSLL